MRKLAYLITFLSIFIYQAFLLAQKPQDSLNISPFNESNIISFQGLWLGTNAWGDFDNDNDLDIFISGVTDQNEVISKIYRNDGDGIFDAQEQIEITGVCLSLAAWGDYNNDGNIDLIICGNTSAKFSKPITKIYKNNGDGTFIELSSLNLPGVFQGVVKWFDYNNDGLLDFILTGQSENSLITKIFSNKGNDIFEENTSINLPGVRNGSIACADYDKDYDNDILITGFDGVSRITKLFRNESGFSFSEVSSVSLVGVSDGNATWGDYDNDGNLDILLNGFNGNEGITKIYKNIGGEFIEQTEINLMGVYYGTSQFADFDNDGYLDIILTGIEEETSNPISLIYRNRRNNSFVVNTSTSIKKVFFSSLCVADFDDDTDLDVLLCGRTSENIITELVSNFNSSTNTHPNEPTNLSESVQGNAVILSWAKSDDMETPTDGLTYNIVVSSLPNEINKLSPMSDRNSGVRKIIAIGNANQDTAWIIKDLPKGKYYWSVQAIDNSFAGSNFAQERSFINYTPFEEQNSISLKGVLYSSAAWGDYDNDGFLDIVVTGSHQTDQGISKIYRNNGDNTFTDQVQISLTGVYESSTAWGDYDNDGYIDLVISGYIAPNSPKTVLYRNNGDNTFTEKSNITFVDVALSSLAWGDYNNDGKLDLLVTGRSTNGFVSKLYKNNGDDSFTEQTQINLKPVSQGSVAWGDYDNDGYLDILLTGTSGFLRTEAKIYRNNGDDSFTEQSHIKLTGVYHSSAAWGDYNNDGYLDIVLTGYDGNIPISKIYKNNGDNSFTEQTNISLVGVNNGSAAWGDYDNDGFLDLILTGTDLNNVSTSKIYRNDQLNNFIEQSDISLPGIRISSSCWADYDNDGDLDILLSGNTGSSRITKIFRNNVPYSNQLPSAPANLKTEIIGNIVTLKWNKAFDAETPAQGLTYNLQIKSFPTGSYVLSPMSDSAAGNRRLISIGNANHDTFFVINDLPPGIYEWSVQSIDNSFAGSNFSEKSYFHYGGVKVIPEGLLNQNTNTLNLRDTIKAYLKKLLAPHEIVDSAVAVVDSITFIADFHFTNAASGNYYLVIKHRNSIETWSNSSGVNFIEGTPLTYDFTSDSTQAYGGNLTRKGLYWCIFSGDINQDGAIDGADILILLNDINKGISGYVSSDITGDSVIDQNDYSIVYDNIQLIIGVQQP